MIVTIGLDAGNRAMHDRAGGSVPPAVRRRQSGSAGDDDGSPSKGTSCAAAVAAATFWAKSEVSFSGPGMDVAGDGVGADGARIGAVVAGDDPGPQAATAIARTATQRPASPLRTHIPPR